ERYRHHLQEIVAERTQQLARTAESLREASVENQAILDAATVGIGLVKDRVVVRGNRKAEEIFGVEPGGFDGQSTRSWYATDEEYLKGGPEVYAHVMRGETHRREQLLLRHDGT